MTASSPLELVQKQPIGLGFMQSPPLFPEMELKREPLQGSCSGVVSPNATNAKLVEYGVD